MGAPGIAWQGMESEMEGGRFAARKAGRQGPQTQAWYAEQSVNLPNAITTLRLALVPVFAWLHLDGQSFAAMVVFSVAALSDGIDGLLARLLDQRTRIGAILDPIADKLLVATALILLVLSQTLPPWLLVAALLRDAAVAGLGLASKLQERWIEVAPTRISKYATFTVMLTIFLALGLRTEIQAGALLPFLQVMAILAAECLLIASLQYLFRWKEFLRN